MCFVLLFRRLQEGGGPLDWEIEEVPEEDTESWAAVRSARRQRRSYERCLRVVASICSNCCWCLLLCGVLYYTYWFVMTPTVAGGYGYTTTTGSSDGSGSSSGAGDYEEVEVVAHGKHGWLEWTYWWPLGGQT